MKKTKETIGNVDRKDLMNGFKEILDGEQIVRIIGAALIAFVVMGNTKGGE